MKWKGFIQIFLVTLLMPWIICRKIEDSAMRQSHFETQILETEQSITEQAEREKEENIIEVICADTNPEIMPMETYILGVVLGEMPASFPEEALKAQAVVARTYVLRMREGSSKHTDADVCVRPECCQSYRSGVSSPVRDAVEATAGVKVTMVDINICGIVR